MATARERTLALKGKKVAKAAGVLRFTVDGKTFDVDPRTLTIREAWAAKQMLTDSEYPADNNHFATAATAWIIARRDVPDLDFETVIDALTIGDILDSVDDVTEDLDNPER